MAAKKTGGEAVLTIPAMMEGTVALRIIGITPMFQRRMSAKVKQGLLVGTRKKTAAERIEIKHHPYEEFRDSVERLESGPTLLGVSSLAIKAAMSEAAIDTAGITKTSTQRLIFVPGDLLSLYGTPLLRTDVVRSADINRTPDIRTRAFLPQWGAEVTLSYIMPQFSMQAIATLLSNAGIIIGIGDFRQGKGKGNFGRFRVIGAEQQDDEWDELVALHGRDAQNEALENPVFANAETEELVRYYDEEIGRRRDTVVAMPKARQSKSSVMTTRKKSRAARKAA